MVEQPDPTETEAQSVARTILAVQGIRAALYGFGSVVLGEALAAEGLSAAAVGGVFAAMLVGMAAGTIAVGRWGDAFGRRRAYGALLLVMGGAGTVFALTSWVPALVLAAITGTLSTDPNESGPITTLEQAMLSGVPAAIRVRVFGRYNAVAYLAGSFGALVAGGPSILRRVVPALPADQRWLLFFPVLAVACAALTRRLPARFDVQRDRHVRGLQRSRRQVRRLSVLFGIDAFGGGFVVQSFMVYWFHQRFAASVGLMGLVFFVVGLLQAGSSLAATSVSRRIGLLNTMVFTHLPSNLLLVAVALVPTLPLAIAALLARSALSQMDVPARQGYIAALVDPDELTAAAASTNTARYAVRPLGPLIAGGLMQGVLAGPFIAAGGIKIVYDLILFATFRRAAVGPEVPAAGDTGDQVEKR
ncbi:MAG: MFS transporter [Candidatus Dormibacteraeota bacterium]|nr:MFS transporter [Candidatus Dormibacteraeota bacterium]